MQSTVTRCVGTGHHRHAVTQQGTDLGVCNRRLRFGELGRHLASAMIASQRRCTVCPLAGKQYITCPPAALRAHSLVQRCQLQHTFINNYNSGNLIGIDFDIEAGQSQSDINNLVARVQTAQSKYPNLRFSFTIATLATSQSGSSTAVDMGRQFAQPVPGKPVDGYQW